MQILTINILVLKDPYDSMFDYNLDRSLKFYKPLRAYLYCEFILLVFVRPKNVYIEDFIHEFKALFNLRVHEYSTGKILDPLNYKKRNTPPKQLFDRLLKDIKPINIIDYPAFKTYCIIQERENVKKQLKQLKINKDSFKK